MLDQGRGCRPGLICSQIPLRAGKAKRKKLCVDLHCHYDWSRARFFPRSSYRVIRYHLRNNGACKSGHLLAVFTCTRAYRPRCPCSAVFLEHLSRTRAVVRASARVALLYQLRDRICCLLRPSVHSALACEHQAARCRCQYPTKSGDVALCIASPATRKVWSPFDMRRLSSRHELSCA
jgi:hypothetical protein